MNICRWMDNDEYCTHYDNQENKCYLSISDLKLRVITRLPNTYQLIMPECKGCFHSLNGLEKLLKLNIKLDNKDRKGDMLIKEFDSSVLNP